jgi:hypothetical protein
VATGSSAGEESPGWDEAVQAAETGLWTPHKTSSVLEIPLNAWDII